MSKSEFTASIVIAAGSCVLLAIAWRRHGQSASPPASSWILHLIPDESRRDGTVFVEMRAVDSHAAFRMPEGIWPSQPTATPGGAGAVEHENWLRANVKYRASDVVVATYPKCGTTLMEQIVLLLLNGGTADALDPLSKNAANLHGGIGKVWPEACVMPDDDCGRPPPGRPPKEEMEPLALSAFDALASPRLIKTHAPVSRLLGGAVDGVPAPARYVVVSRNPLDACVSCFYHAWNPHKNGWPFEAFAEAWLAGWGNGAFGSWVDFHLGWHAVSQRHGEGLPSSDGHGRGRGVLWVHYEDLVREPTAQIRRISAFLGLSTEAQLIERVVRGSSFDTMKAAAVKAEQKGGRGTDKVGGMTSAHLRKGGVGDWRKHFSPALAARFREHLSARLQGSGLTFDIGDGEVLSFT